MGVLFEMENDFTDISGKFFQESTGKNPSNFKVALVKRDEPHLPIQEVNGFNPRNITTYRMNPWSSSWEITALNYDVVLKIDDIVLRMQYQEFRNLVNALDIRSNKFSRFISKNSSPADNDIIINSIRERTTS